MWWNTGLLAFIAVMVLLMHLEISHRKTTVEQVDQDEYAPNVIEFQVGDKILLWFEKPQRQEMMLLAKRKFEAMGLTVDTMAGIEVPNTVYDIAKPQHPTS